MLPCWNSRGLYHVIQLYVIRYYYLGGPLNDFVLRTALRRRPSGRLRFRLFHFSTSRTGVSGLTPALRRASVSLPLSRQLPLTAAWAASVQRSSQSPNE